MDARRPALELHQRAPAVDDGRPPLLFVHGLGHGAWCWEHWLGAAADAGYPAYAVSLRGHGGSPGRLRTARIGQYVDDVVATAESLPRPPSSSATPWAAWSCSRRWPGTPRAPPSSWPRPGHPGRALAGGHRPPAPPRCPADRRWWLAAAAGGLPLPRVGAGRRAPAHRPLPRRVRRRPVPAAAAQAGREPLGAPPVLVLATPDDRLVPIRGIRSTARAVRRHDRRSSPGWGTTSCSTPAGGSRSTRCWGGCGPPSRLPEFSEPLRSSVPGPFRSLTPPGEALHVRVKTCPLNDRIEA